MQHKINHPRADLISVITGSSALCAEGQVEIAFFKDGRWVVEPIDPFVEYFVVRGLTTAVYANVPINLVEGFLNEYSTGGAPKETRYDVGGLTPDEKTILAEGTAVYREILRKKNKPTS
jgi:hypothetical protein